jgi:hypothetical protein
VSSFPLLVSTHAHAFALAYGRSALTFIGIADEAQLAILTKILDDHCTELGIANDDPAREALGGQIMALFNCGCYSLERIEQLLRVPPEEAA